MSSPSNVYHKLERLGPRAGLGSEHTRKYKLMKRELQEFMKNGNHRRLPLFNPSKPPDTPWDLANYAVDFYRSPSTTYLEQLTFESVMNNNKKTSGVAILRQRLFGRTTTEGTEQQRRRRDRLKEALKKSELGIIAEKGKEKDMREKGTGWDAKKKENVVKLAHFFQVEYGDLLKGAPVENFPTTNLLDESSKTPTEPAEDQTIRRVVNLLMHNLRDHEFVCTNCQQNLRDVVHFLCTTREHRCKVFQRKAEKGQTRPTVVSREDPVRLAPISVEITSKVQPGTVLLSPNVNIMDDEDDDNDRPTQVKEMPTNEGEIIHGEIRCGGSVVQETVQVDVIDKDITDPEEIRKLFEDAQLLHEDGTKAVGFMVELRDFTQKRRQTIIPDNPVVFTAQTRIYDRIISYLDTCVKEMNVLLPRFERALTTNDGESMRELFLQLKRIVYTFENACHDPNEALNYVVKQFTAPRDDITMTFDKIDDEIMDPFSGLSDDTESAHHIKRHKSNGSSNDDSSIDNEIQDRIFHGTDPSIQLIQSSEDRAEQPSYGAFSQSNDACWAYQPMDDFVPLKTDPVYEMGESYEMMESQDHYNLNTYTGASVYRNINMSDSARDSYQRGVSGPGSGTRSSSTRFPYATVSIQALRSRPSKARESQEEKHKREDNHRGDVEDFFSSGSTSPSKFTKLLSGIDSETDDRVLNIHFGSTSGKALLEFYARRNDLPMAKALVKLNPKIESSWDVCSERALFYLAQHNYYTITKMFFDKIPGVKTDFDPNPLNASVYFGHETMVDLLLDNDADVNIPSSKEKYTAAFIAVSNRDVEMFMQVLPKTDLTHRCAAGYTLLHLAVLDHKDYIVEEILKQDKSNIDDKSDEGFTALHYAVLLGDLVLIELLLKYKASYSILSSEDKLAFEYAFDNRQDCPDVWSFMAQHVEPELEEETESLQQMYPYGQTYPYGDRTKMSPTSHDQSTTYPEIQLLSSTKSSSELQPEEYLKNLFQRLKIAQKYVDTFVAEGLKTEMDLLELEEEELREMVPTLFDRKRLKKHIGKLRRAA